MTEKRKYITKKARMRLYGASRHLGASQRRELGLSIPFQVYLQDPLVARDDPKFGFDKKYFVRWEPSITDGPTSARFAVVDYNNDTGTLAPMAKWRNATSKELKDCFVDEEGKELNQRNSKSLQFHQVNVWAILQRALEFFESGPGLGRPIPFGFEGNRLIVVPHAGYGKNAFYDRKSKSLQFYYFGEDDERVYTCLSADIINHEFAHAVLDGIRPYYYNSTLVQTAAFHEFVGDLTAILLMLRNNTFRPRIAKTTGGNLSKAKMLSSIAVQFGQAVSDKPYLRTAQNSKTMLDVLRSNSPHYVSEVLTGAMFDILMELASHYMTRHKSGPEKDKTSPAEAFWMAIDRMQRVAIQPLDLLPPADVTFKDYALAVLRAEMIANPTDPYGHFDRMLKVFVKRKILRPKDATELKRPRYVFHRQRVAVDHKIEDIARSRAAAFNFLNDNREQFFIPAQQDIIIADLYDANKLTRQGMSLPRQYVLEYLWREEVELTGSRFGKYRGEATNMLCGGTLVFDENGNVISWFRKPGTEGSGTKWKNEKANGVARRDKLLLDLAGRIRDGHVGTVIGSGKGLLGSQIPPITVTKKDGLLEFGLTPHLHLVGEDHEHYEGGSRWEISS